MADYDERFVASVWDSYRMLGAALDSWTRADASYCASAATRQSLASLSVQCARRLAESMSPRVGDTSPAAKARGLTKLAAAKRAAGKWDEALALYESAANQYVQCNRGMSPEAIDCRANAAEIRAVCMGQYSMACGMYEGLAECANEVEEESMKQMAIKFCAMSMLCRMANVDVPGNRTAQLDHLCAVVPAFGGSYECRVLRRLIENPEESFVSDWPTNPPEYALLRAYYRAKN